MRRPGALSLREVLANGHGDTYYQYRTGQAFRLGDLEDGNYFIAVEANPDDEDGRNLQELDYTNNESYRKVRAVHQRQGRPEGADGQGRDHRRVRRVRAFRMR